MELNKNNQEGIPEKTATIKALQRTILEMRYEMDRMERYLENLTNRGSALMMIAGLISLIPFTVGENAYAFLGHYLIWIAPYLGIAIFAFIKSLSRRHLYRPELEVKSGVVDEIAELHDEAHIHKEMWKQISENFAESLKWHRLNRAAISVFLISYVLNLYLSYFSHPPSNDLMFGMTAALLILGFYLYKEPARKSFEKYYHGSSYGMALGGIPNEDEIP
jgi:hypothetical protein